MKTAREFYEYHGVKQPKKLLPREEFMFEKLNEDIQIVTSANTQLSVDLATEKVEKTDLSQRIRKIIFDDNCLDWTLASVIGGGVLVLTILISSTYFGGIIESKNKTINQLNNTEVGILTNQNKKLSDDNRKLKDKVTKQKEELDKYKCALFLCVR